MASVKIVLDTRRPRKDETFPIVFRVRHKRKYFDIPTLKSTEQNNIIAQLQKVDCDIIT
jgi:hypothetical protein